MTVKTVFLGKPDGRREAGRRKLRWLDCIQNCLKSTDEGWKQKADLYGLSFWSRQWLHCKDRTPTKKNEDFIWSACYFRSILTANEFSEQILVEIPNRKFHRNPLKLEASCSTQGDGRTEAERHEEVHIRLSQVIANAAWKLSAMFVVHFTTVKLQLTFFVFFSVLPPYSLCLSIRTWHVFKHPPPPPPV